MYHLCVRVKGKKWVTVATWAGGPDSCQALAEDVFSGHGLTSIHAGYRVQWDSIRERKNWSGYSDHCLTLHDTTEDARMFAEARRERTRATMQTV
jgi:hypothetical protein